jgi:hypothetical protein
MNSALRYLPFAICCLGSLTAHAADAVDALSGLPIAPGFQKLRDPVESYSYCGKSARAISYVSDGSADTDHENTWYAHAISGAVVFTAVGGVKTFITPDGTAAVETAGPIISFLRFAPGLSPAEMKILGEAPAARACTAH